MEINRTYLIRIFIGEKLLTYTGKIIKIDDHFVEFEDKFKKTISVNKNNIQSFEEVGE